MTITKTETTVVEDLRALADFLERRTILTEQVSFSTAYVFTYNSDDFTKMISMIGGFDKKVDDYSMKAIKKFGSIELMVHIGRANMCEKVVVGTRQVETTRDVYPDGVVPESVTEMVDENITEWSCPPSWRS
jgi:hypothetical protein